MCLDDARVAFVALFFFSVLLSMMIAALESMHHGSKAVLLFSPLGIIRSERSARREREREKETRRIVVGMRSPGEHR